MAMPKKSSVRLHEPTDQGNVRLYTLEVFLLSGPITEKFAKENPEISRTIQIRGDQTLEDLHHALFDAFDRSDEHMYGDSSRISTRLSRDSTWCLSGLGLRLAVFDGF